MNRRHGRAWHFLFDPLAPRPDLASSKHGVAWHLFLDPLYVCRAHLILLPLTLGIVFGTGAGVAAAVNNSAGPLRGAIAATVICALTAVSLEIPLLLWVLYVRFLTRRKKAGNRSPSNPTPDLEGAQETQWTGKPEPPKAGPQP
jgi:hypothetical protein